ncbi:MAG: serine/threonine protein kinase [Bacteriovoracaceae bacterium]
MNSSMWGNSQTHHFYNLDPNQIMDAVDACGFKTTGRYLQLNSMENRVFELEIELPKNLNKIIYPHDRFKIAKFYRPQRWSKEQILEEHQFLLDLKRNNISVIAPLEIEGETLFEIPSLDIHYSVYDKVPGRSPQELSLEDFTRLGYLTAKIHQIGKKSKFQHRNEISTQLYGQSNIAFLLQKNFIPLHLCSSIEKSVESICQKGHPYLANAEKQRVHGDLHLGNIIHDGKDFVFLDFDDSFMGPIVQDLWLFLPAHEQESKQHFWDGYEQVNIIKNDQKPLIELLRALRYIHMTGWIARRWSDPSFKINFPHFEEDMYWENFNKDLLIQQKIIEESLL